MARASESPLMAFLRRRDPRPKFSQLTIEQRAITIYSEGGQYWPHFEGIIREITEGHNLPVSFLTSSSSDPVLDDPPPRVLPFFIGEGFKRSYAFQTMEAGVVVATVPQIGTKLLPKSLRTEALGIKYLYVFHSMVSTHMAYEADAFDHFDTVFCTGPYMETEIRRREMMYGLPPKELVLHGYGRLDAIIRNRSESATNNSPPVVLVAPSWGPSCIFETCGSAVIAELLETGAEVIARPHPMTLKKSNGVIEELSKRFQANPKFSLDLDVSSQDSLQRSDVMVSDWSGAALEYAFGTLKPVLFIDVERKVNNQAYAELDIEPFESSIRDQIGEVVSPNNLAGIAPALLSLLQTSEQRRESISALRDATISNLGNSAAIAAELIVEKALTFIRAQGAR